jgi:8-oxo-dGTP pyrophosphatase MutT (NUDIX family)
LLAGGDFMQKFVENTLSSERNGAARSKEIRADIHANPNSELKVDRATGASGLRRNIMNESVAGKNATAIIIDNDNKILLLKRGDGGDTSIWMPNKWSLVGGGIEKGESPERAVKREIMEETGLEIKKFIKSFTIERDGIVEYIFACRYNGEDYDIQLDYENSGYGWFTVAELDYLDTVPHLVEYITMVFKKYD